MKRSTRIRSVKHIQVVRVIVQASDLSDRLGHSQSMTLHDASVEEVFGIIESVFKDIEEAQDEGGTKW